MNTLPNNINTPKVSVILTSFNHDKFIREAIDSVLNQTFVDFELIIWDDASNDNSWVVISSYSDPRVKAFRNEVTKRGIYGINKAIADVASGEYIAIHHSDDVWELDKLEKQVAILEGHPDVGAVFTNALATDERGVPLTDKSHTYCDIFNQVNRTRYEWLRHFFLRGNALCHPSILIRKSCYLNCGLYRLGLGQLGDFDMWVRLCAQYEIYVMPDRLIRFRVRDGEMNTSGNRPESRIRLFNENQKVLQLYRTILGQNNIFKIFPDFISYDRGEHTDAEYVLSRVCLESGSFFLWQMLAIDILFDIINNPSRKQAIEEVYGFTTSDFIAITGKCDLFSRETTLQLQIEVNERDAQMNNFITDLDVQIKSFVTDRDTQVNDLNHIIAEKDIQINNLIAEQDAQIN